MQGDRQSYQQADGVAVVGGEGPARLLVEQWLPDSAAGFPDASAAHTVPRVVAADSGLERARQLGLPVDMVVGDMDSLSDHGLLDAFPPDRIRRAAAAKDESDTELALSTLRELGVERPLILGGGGGRTDHLLAILALFERDDPPYAWITAREEIVTVSHSIRLEGLANSTVSFFPLGPERCRMRSEGLQWPLDALEWRHGDHGLSNRVIGDMAHVEMQSGRLLMIRPMET